MKKIISSLLLVAIFATMLSISAFAANASELTIVTDKASVAAGETVLVTVTAKGNFLNVASVSTSIAFDTDKFSIDTTTKDYNEAVDDDFYVCFDADWVDSIMNDKKNSLGRLAAPMSAAGENPQGQLNVVFQKSSGLTTSNSNLTVDGSVVTTVAAIFTAKVDVETIDATCFSLVEGVCKIETASKELHSLTYNQIEAAGPEYEEKGDALTADKSVEAADGKTKWNDLAIYKASFNLNTLVAEQGYGFKVNNEKKAITINGEGTVDYVLAFFGVAADEVPAVSTYYSVVKANN